VFILHISRRDNDHDDGLVTAKRIHRMALKKMIQAKKQEPCGNKLIMIGKKKIRKINFNADLVLFVDNFEWTFQNGRNN